MALVSTAFKEKSNLISVKIDGLAEIISRMNKLADNLQYRMLVDVMKKSLSQALEEARSRAPLGPAIERTHRKSGARFTNIPGILKRSFRIKKMRSTNPFILEVQLQNTAFYALWVEMGHRVVRGKKGNRRVVGHTRAYPFMRPTYESQKEAIIERVNVELRAALARRGV